jgi:hypothetical protein
MTILAKRASRGSTQLHHSHHAADGVSAIDGRIDVLLEAEDEPTG